MAKVTTVSAGRIANRVKGIGAADFEDARGRRLDIVVTMDRSFMFAADLIRAIDGPVVVHFVGEDVRDVELGGKARREVFFGNRAARDIERIERIEGAGCPAGGLGVWTAE